MCKLPLSVEIQGIQTRVRLRGLTFSLLQAGFVCVAAISNRPVFLPNWDAPDGQSLRINDTSLPLPFPNQFVGNSFEWLQFNIYN